MGVDKGDWEWLVKEHFLSDKFKAEIHDLVQSEPSLTNIEVVERCFGPQCKSHVVGFGGGITTKELKGGTTSKTALLEELKTTRKEKESLQKRMDILESKYERLETIVVHQSSSVASPPGAQVSFGSWFIAGQWSNLLYSELEKAHSKNRWSLMTIEMH